MSASPRTVLRRTAAALGAAALAAVLIAAPAAALPAHRGGGNGGPGGPGGPGGGHGGGGWGGGGGNAPKPTIVLVHGAFADASGWTEVTLRLQAKGYTVYAPSNPLRNIPNDSAYLRSFLDTLTGPIVLVGHSYGGAVITNTATGDPDVVALVYIAAFALDAGETVQAATELGGGHSDLIEHVVLRPYPGAPEGDADGYLDPAVYPERFAGDLPRKEAAAAAALQRPAALASFVVPSGEPAWKTIPSWYLVAKNDKIIPPAAERAMAARAGSTTVEVRSSHVPMQSQPDTVVDLILKAVAATK